MIVITGPDGSGKSTLLDKIAEANASIPILKVPNTEPDKFSGNKEVQGVCKFINELGVIADIEKSPSLKIISMFSAMLVFEELHSILQQRSEKVICERHPILDTGVYAKIYFKYMDPALLNLKRVEPLERKYANEMGYILEQIKMPVENSGQSSCFDLLKFLHQWFTDEVNYLPKRLEQLFTIKKPEKIVLLDAPTKILAKRIAVRNKREFHENENMLEKMRILYQEALQKFGVPYEVINTQEVQNSTILVERIMEI